MGIFVGPLMNLHNNRFTALWLKGRTFRFPLIVLNVFKMALIMAIALIPIGTLFNVKLIWLFFIFIVVVTLLAKHDGMTGWYLQLETRFLMNFNEKLIEKEEAKGKKQDWLYDRIHIISFVVPEDKNFVGKKLRDLDWAYKYNVYVVKIRRGKHTIILPKQDEVVKAGDKLYMVGEKIAITNFYKIIDSEPCKRMRTIREFMESGYPDIENALSICAIKIDGNESYAGKSIRNGKLKHNWGCLVLGVQRGGLPILMPRATMILSKGDIVWVMGSNNNVGRVAYEHID
jgi:CPA2 family monovalent cation:H+ antiporter-2